MSLAISVSQSPPFQEFESGYCYAYISVFTLVKSAVNLNTIMMSKHIPELVFVHSVQTFTIFVQAVGFGVGVFPSYLVVQRHDAFGQVVVDFS